VPTDPLNGADSSFVSVTIGLNGAPFVETNTE
jgi:hypothetical protein